MLSTAPASPARAAREGEVPPPVFGTTSTVSVIAMMASAPLTCQIMRQSVSQSPASKASAMPVGMKQLHRAIAKSRRFGLATR